MTCRGPNLATLSGPKLVALIERRREVVSEANLALISAGFGMQLGSETRRKAKEGDKLSQAWVDAIEALYAAQDELDARRRYHGGDKPIRRKETF